MVVASRNVTFDLASHMEPEFMLVNEKAAKYAFVLLGGKRTNEKKCAIACVAFVTLTQSIYLDKCLHVKHISPEEKATGNGNKRFREWCIDSLNNCLTLHLFMTSFCIAKTKKVKVQITLDLLESSFYKAGQTVRQKVISEAIQEELNG